MEKLIYFLIRHKYPTLLFLLCLIFNQRIIFHPNTPLLGGDIWDIYLLEKTYLIESIKTFHILPLWNPYSFGGTPFIASSTPAVFYPINLLFFLFPVKNTFNYIFVLDVFLAGLFTYFFARKIKLSGFSAFFSAISFMFSGVIFSRIISGHIYIIDSIIWLPAVLFFLESYFQNGKKFFCILAGACLGLIILAGGAQFALYTLLATLIFIFFRGGLKRIIISITLMVIVAFSISAVQLLPSQEFSKISTRSQGINYTFAADFSLHPLQTSMFLFPFSFGSPVQKTYWGKGYFHETSGYAGILAVFFASYAIFSKKHKKYTLNFLFLLLFSLFLAYGRYIPIFRLFYLYIPGFSSFRVPSRFIFVTTFSLVMLAGIGLEAFSPKNLQKKIIITLSLVWFLIGAGSFFLIPFYKKLLELDPHSHFVSRTKLINQFTKDVYLFTFLVCILLITTFLIQKNKIRLSSFKFILIFLACLDLGTFTLHIMSYDFPKILNNPTPKIKSILKSDKNNFRVFDLSGHLFSYLQQMNIEEVMGIQAMQIKNSKQLLWLAGDHIDDLSESFYEFNSLTNITPLTLFNVKYIISDRQLNLQNLEFLLKENNFYLYKNIDFIPKAFTVENIDYLSKNKDVLNKISSNTFNPKKLAIIQNMNYELRIKNHDIKNLNLSIYKPAEIKYINPNKFVFSIAIDRPSFLVISNPYYPGWKAYNNGKEIKIYRTDYALSGIQLIKKGSHKITYVYDPLSLKIGAIITTTVIFIFLIYITRITYYSKFRQRENKFST